MTLPWSIEEPDAAHAYKVRGEERRSTSKGQKDGCLLQRSMETEKKDMPSN